MGRLCGSSDSPMWKRGWCSFSSRVTRQPFSASKAEMVEPAGPPPTTRTSHSPLAAGIFVPEMLGLVRPSLPTFLASHLHPPTRLELILELTPALLPIFAAGAW